MPIAHDLPAAELEARAAAAAWRSIASSQRTGTKTEPERLPVRASACTIAGRRYVEVFGSAGRLAVYRVRPRGDLKRLVRPPKSMQA